MFCHYCVIKLHSPKYLVLGNLDTNLQIKSVRYGILEVNWCNLLGNDDQDSKYSQAIKFLEIKVTGVLVQGMAKKLHKRLNTIRG